MDDLANYVLAHTERGACRCSKCCDAPTDPDSYQPAGHTADLVFFKVSARDNPDADELRRLLAAHRGEFCNLDPLDGARHSYVEMGGWIGDQLLALMLMGLGSLLELWQLLTPRTILGPDVPQEDVMEMAGTGFVIIQSTKS